jgi:GNAT superfamily N-acetyltransferase
MAPVHTRLATTDDLAAVAALFDGYRQFYGRASDVTGATGFIAERMKRGDSVIILAEAGGKPIGLAQLYPSFSSVRMGRIMILNDLFVAPEHRAVGAGRALLDAATDWSRSVGAVRMTLSTGEDNVAAQRVYEQAGWAHERAFRTYNLELAG